MARAEEILARLDQEALNEGIPVIRQTERKMLLSAAALSQPRRILEIGTAIGLSAILLAVHFPAAEIDTIEIDEERRLRAVQAVEEAGLTRRVHCLSGDAAQIIGTLSGPYDFLYLDGPKGQYLRHLLLAEPMLSEQVVIAADNVLFRGLVEGNESVPHRYRTLVLRLRAYLDYVKNTYCTEIYAEGDGLAVSRRKDKT